MFFCTSYIFSTSIAGNTQRRSPHIGTTNYNLWYCLLTTPTRLHPSLHGRRFEACPILQQLKDRFISNATSDNNEEAACTEVNQENNCVYWQDISNVAGPCDTFRLEYDKLVGSHRVSVDLFEFGSGGAIFVDSTDVELSSSYQKQFLSDAFWIRASTIVPISIIDVLTARTVRIKNLLFPPNNETVTPFLSAGFSMLHIPCTDIDVVLNTTFADTGKCNRPMTLSLPGRVIMDPSV